MALAARPSRRGGAGIRWITVGVVITLLVLLIDASLKSRSPGPVQQMDAGTWVDRVLPVIESSTSEGAEVRDLWSHGLHMSAASIVSSLSGVASGAQANYKTVSSLRPPTQLAGAAGLLEAALLARSRAASSLDQAFNATLGSAATEAASTSRTTTGGSDGATTTSSTTAPPPSGASPSSQAPLVAQAGSDIQVGDQAYKLFQQTFPSTIGVKMPSSIWASDLGPYQAQAAEVFLASLKNTVVTRPVHEVKILSVSITPAPVGRKGAQLVVPDAQSIAATIIVADTGNQPEPNLTVNASVTTSSHTSGTVTVQTVRDFVDLVPGQAYTVDRLGPLSAPEGAPCQLVVTLQPPAGSSTPAVTTTVQFEMPAPPPPTTTTTTTIPTSSTSKH